VTPSEALAAQVSRRVAELAETTTHSQRVKSALAGQQSAIVLVDDLSAAAEVANAYATEHLELQTERNDWLLSKITNAGAIFVGDYSPVSLGDYMAGSNHVLPTGGQAKFGSGLGVHSFLRAQQVINYSSAALAEIVREIDLFARAEGLPAHGDAIKSRD
jgi:histidinol dehydrogenase